MVDALALLSAAAQHHDEKSADYGEDDLVEELVPLLAASFETIGESVARVLSAPVG